MNKSYLLLAIIALFATSDIQAQIWANANKTHRSTSIIPVSGKTIFSLSNHLFFSSDLGQSFTVDEGGISGGVSGFAIGSTGNFYLSAPTGIYSSPSYSDMNNENWVRIDSSNLPPITALLVRSAPGIQAADEFFVGTAAGLFNRTTNTNTWTKIHDALDGLPILQITAFKQSIYYRTATTAWASNDGGKTWTNVGGSVTGNKTAIVATSETDLFLAISGFPGSQILHSTDGGATFNGFKGVAFSSRTIESLVESSTGDLYLGGGVRYDNKQDSITQGYVFHLPPGSFTWEDYSGGLPSGNPKPEVIGMGFGPNGNVFAGTDSAGLWRTLLPSKVTSYASENGIILSPNYPNPANSFTEFSVFTEHTINASLAVFDNLGRNVMQISAGEISPGTHVFRIETSSLPNGTYYYRLQSPDGIASKAFIISK